jgi:transcription antitermination factor NusG
MLSENENVFWYVLFATKGKAAKINDFLTKSNFECFFPLGYKEQRVRNSERTKPALQPLIENLVFVKSSKKRLTPILREVKERFNITDDLYYRYREEKKRIIIVVPEKQMQNFIAVAGCNKERIIYLSNEEVDFEKGTRVRIIGGIFAGVEGMFMNIKRSNRVVVSLPNFLSVATAFIPTRFILPLE